FFTSPPATPPCSPLSLHDALPISLSTNVTLAEETTSRLTLLLDVPVVSPQRQGFAAMVACARSLASRLDGTVVDDSGQRLAEEIDRKSTRLNSSHVKISYAVFCLK